MAEVIDFRVRLPLELRPSEDLPEEYLLQYDEVLSLSDNRHRTFQQLVTDMDGSGVTHAVMHAEYEWGDDADALTEYARERLARYKVPKRFDFGDLPKTSTGKIQKNVLRDRARELYESS